MSLSQKSRPAARPVMHAAMHATVRATPASQIAGSVILQVLRLSILGTGMALVWVVGGVVWRGMAG